MTTSRSKFLVTAANFSRTYRGFKTSKSSRSIVAFVVLLFAIFSPTVQAQYAFQNVANLPLDELVSPLLSNGQIAWDESGTEDVIRFWDGTTTTTVVNESSVIPGSGATFSSTFVPGLSNGVITFRGQGGSPQQRGIYQFDGNAISTIADRSTISPVTGNAFSSFGSYAIDGGDVAFVAQDDSGTTGIFLSSQGTLTQIADTNTQLPGATGTFTGFSGVVIDNGDVAFTNGNPNNSLQTSVHSYSGGVLRTLVTENTIIPGSGQTFSAVRFLIGLDDGTLVVNRGNGQGIYTVPITGGALETIADTSSAVPGGNPTFSSLSGASIEDEIIAFTGRLPEGIYASIDGELVNIISRGDVLNGQTVQDLRLSKDGIDGNQLALNIGFGPSVFDITSRGVFLVTLPTSNTIKGDCDLNGTVELADIPAFISILQSATFLPEADCNCDGTVDFVDIPFLILLLQAG